MAMTSLPTPPSRDDPINFASRADAFLLALPTFQSEANALEVNVTDKEALAAASKLAAGTFSDNALASKNAASDSATSANNSKTNAANSESNALLSKNAAETSKTNAATSEENALASKNAAGTSAGTAAGFASTATTAASTATTKAGDASTSATSASNSKVAASTSETNAGLSAQAAAASYDLFDDRYLGAKSAAPTLDNDGAALLTGALYFDTVIGGGILRVYSGTAWVNTPATSAGGIVNTPAGNLAATNVQAALNELDVEKALLAGNAAQNFSANILTCTTDATLSGVRVGKGAGAIVSNTALGLSALPNNTTGYSNTASGVQTLFYNTTGNGNTASGANALFNNTTGNFNTALGEAAMLEATACNDNVAVGRVALRFNTGNNNTAVGNYSLGFNTTGTDNTANGTSALNASTTGSGNTASGSGSLVNNTTGSFNTAIGLQALQNNTTGVQNTASGTSALKANTTGSGNTAINPNTSTGSYNPVFNPTTENNRFCMGSTGVTNAYIQVAWTVVSDARDKTNFAAMPHGLAFVKALLPVAYQFRTARDSEETNGGVRYGFKAQDVLALEGANPVIVDNEDADKLRMIDTALIPVLVKAIQEQQALIELLTTRLTALESKP